MFVLVGLNTESDKHTHTNTSIISENRILWKYNNMFLLEGNVQKFATSFHTKHLLSLYAFLFDSFSTPPYILCLLFSFKNEVLFILSTRVPNDDVNRDRCCMFNSWMDKFCFEILFAKLCLATARLWDIVKKTTENQIIAKQPNKFVSHYIIGLHFQLIVSKNIKFFILVPIT